MYRLTNVSLDHRFQASRARAQALQMEPLVCGKRLRLRQSLVVTDAEFDGDRQRIELAKTHGVLSYERIQADKQALPEEVPAPVAAPEVPPAPVEQAASPEPPAVPEPPAQVTAATPPPPPSVNQPRPNKPQKK